MQPSVNSSPISAQVPCHLSPEAAKQFTTIAEGYGISDSAGILLLSLAMEALDAMRSAQATLKKEGRYYKSQQGLVRQHPAAAAEREARYAMLKALKSLNLDIQPSEPAPGRPANKPRKPNHW